MDILNAFDLLLEALPVTEEVWIHRSTRKRARMWIEGGRTVVGYQVEDGFIFRDYRLSFLHLGPPRSALHIPAFEARHYFELPGSRGRAFHYDRGIDADLSAILFRLSDWRQYQLDQISKKYGEQLIAALRALKSLETDEGDAAEPGEAISDET